MKKRRKARKNTGFFMILALVAFLVSCACVLTGGYVQDGYELRVGATSPKRFRAPRAVENTMATERARAERANAVPMQYKIDPNVKLDVLGRLDTFFAETSQIRADYAPIFNPSETETQQVDLSAIDRSQLQVLMTYEQLVLLTTADSAFYTEFRDVIIQVVTFTMDAGVREGTLNISLLSAREELNQYDWGTAQHTLASAIVTAVITPNNLADPEGTEALRTQEMAKVEPVMFIEGQKIIDEDEVITPEIFLVLSALGYVGNGLSRNWLPMLGAAALVGLLLGSALLYMRTHRDKKRLLRRKEALLLFALFVGCILAARAMVALPSFFTPVLLFSMLIAVLLDTRLAVVMNLVMTMICAMICLGDMKFIIFFALTGTFSAVLAKHVIERNRVFMIGLLMSGINAAAVASIYLLFDKGYSAAMLDGLVYSVMMGLLSVMLCIGTLPFWEVAFGVVTPIKLLELTNPNSRMLQRLIIEAPGTYHHSLIVANLAETAAYDIGANHILARVGGYYHDAGKMKYPQYFAENQAGENPHDGMTPYESADVLIEHVTNGVALALEYKLPKIVSDIVLQHHGTSMIKYFFVKAQQESPDDPVDENDFRYPGQIPQFRESAVVMLADTIEAAVRSAMPAGKTMAETEAFVRMLIKDKLDDGQLEDSELSIKDMDTIALSFMRVFKGMYHERIPYPKGSTKELKAAAKKAKRAEEESADEQLDEPVEER